tara:strand:- start:3 stop:332 length:330 start_codon:yes stop_codon:yes gene_type:complete
MIQAIKLIGQLGNTFLQGRIAKSEAKAKAAQDWETVAQQNAGNSWKDEWLTVLFSLPLVMCFIPSAVPYVKDGFAVLQEMPTWYQYMLSVIVAASFGVRSAVGIMNRKK